jgi:hypothetical protein
VEEDGDLEEETEQFKTQFAEENERLRKQIVEGKEESGDIVWLRLQKKEGQVAAAPSAI